MTWFSAAKLVGLIALVSFIAASANAEPAPDLCVDAVCSDVVMWYGCESGTCSKFSLPTCQWCKDVGRCRYRSAGEPNTCNQSIPLKNITWYLSNSCDEDCLCLLRGDPTTILYVEARNFTDGDSGNTIQRYECSNARVVPAG